MTCQRIGSLLVILVVGLSVGGVAVGPAAAQDTLRHTEGHSTADHYDHSFEDPEHYADRWNDPARDDWQKPDAVIQAMGLEEGMTVADLGAGTGYFIPHLSRAVGETGKVLAIDIEPAMLDYISRLADEKGLENVTTVPAKPENTRLDSASVDRILTVNTWHHIPNRGDYAEHLAGRLTEGGSVWVIDYTKDAPMGPPPEHRMGPQVVVGELGLGGFNAEVVDLGLPYQYVVVGRLE